MKYKETERREVNTTRNEFERTRIVATKEPPPKNRKYKAKVKQRKEEYSRCTMAGKVRGKEQKEKEEEDKENEAGAFAVRE